MKKVLHKLMSLSLAILVLGSTMSFSIAKHYCGEHLVDVAFFGDAEPCAMEKALTRKYGEAHTKSLDCCFDDKVVIQGQDELKIQLENITTDTSVFIQALAYSFTILLNGDGEPYVSFDGYPPPLIVSDFHLLYEQFLI